MSNEENNKEIKALLKAAISPVKDPELRSDLWPQMLRKLPVPSPIHFKPSACRKRAENDALRRRS